MPKHENYETVTHMYNEAVNKGVDTLDGQFEALQEFAEEVGVTISELEAMRNDRNTEAGVAVSKLKADLMAQGNMAQSSHEDDWRHTGDN